MEQAMLKCLENPLKTRKSAFIAMGSRKEMLFFVTHKAKVFRAGFFIGKKKIGARSMWAVTARAGQYSPLSCRIRPVTDGVIIPEILNYMFSRKFLPMTI